MRRELIAGVAVVLMKLPSDSGVLGSGAGNGAGGQRLAALPGGFEIGTKRRALDISPHATLGTQVALYKHQLALAERVAGALYLPLDRLQASARHLARRHVCLGAARAGREALQALLAARGTPPLSEREFAERLPVGPLASSFAGAGAGFCTAGAVEALEGLLAWKRGALGWLEMGFGGDEEALSEGTAQWAAALGRGLSEHVEPGGVGALVQLLLDAQVVAELSQGSGAALAEELATAWQPQLCAALLAKLRGLVGTVQQASLLADVWPYLEAVLPKHIPAKLLAPLRVAIQSIQPAIGEKPVLGDESSKRKRGIECGRGMGFGKDESITRRIFGISKIDVHHSSVQAGEQFGLGEGTADMSPAGTGDEFEA